MDMKEATDVSATSEDLSVLDEVKAGISQRAAELRTDAVNEIKDIRGELELAQKQVEEYRVSLIDAVKVAASVGVSKDQLATQTGFSTSTVGNWIRGEEKGRRKKAPKE